jgi:hypothetical protein
VYRNTVVTNTAEARAVWVGGVPHGRIRFWNNVLLSSGPGVLVEISPGQKDVVFLGNAYWSRKGPFTVLDHGTAFASLDLWRSLTGQEMWKGRPRGVYAARPE